MTTANVANHGSSFTYSITNSYHSETGQADNLSVSNGSTTVQNLTYTYDVFGNLKTRHTAHGGGTTETFTYDKLQRVTQSDRVYTSGGDTVNYAFDAAGSFKTKSD